MIEVYVMYKVKLHEMLKKHGMTIEELSQRTGIPEEEIRKLCEENQIDTNIDYINSICDVFDCGISEMVEKVSE